MNSKLWDYHGVKHRGLQLTECNGDRRLVPYVPLGIKKISLSYVDKLKSWSRNAWLHRFPGKWRQSPGTKQIVVMLVNQWCIYTWYWSNYVSIYIFICRFGRRFFRCSCLGSLLKQGLHWTLNNDKHYFEAHYEFQNSKCIYIYNRLSDWIKSTSYTGECCL